MFCFQSALLKRSVVTLAVLTLCFSSAAYGDDASKTAKVEEFFRLARMDEMLRRILELSTSQMQASFIQKMMGVKYTPEQQKMVAEFQGRLGNVIVSALDWQKLKPSYVKLFTDAYSEAELDDIVAFYRSPTGQAMVSKNPALMTKSSEIVQERMSAAQSQIQQLMRDFLVQLGHQSKKGESQ